jgi:transcription elongation factor GreA
MSVGPALDEGEQSPLGVAILGRHEGETVTYTAPNGKEITVELIAVKTYSF